MIILLHVLIALTSILTSGYAFFRPGNRSLHASYALIGLTLMSGFYLVISTHQPILASCETGLVYLSIALTATLAAQRKLTAED